MRSFVQELRRRNVFRAAAFYAASAWLVVQVAAQLFPLFHLPEWALRWIVVALVIGFPCAIVFAWLYEWTPAGLVREADVDRTRSVTRDTGRRLDRWIIATLAAAVVLLVADRFVLRKDADTVGDKSIAVLPFVNTSGDAGNEYFSDGLSEELISSLSRLGDLKVIGRTSSFQFKGRTEDSAEIGQKLGVVYLLEGSVRKSDDRVRIAAQLVKSADGTNVWSESYDRKVNDIFAVQAEIARVVADQLQVALLGKSANAAEVRPAAPRKDPSFEAYTAFLQGNAALLRHTSADMKKAMAYYEEAIRLEPDYAGAYAQLANAQVQMLTIFVSAPAEATDLIAKSRANAARALALDPELGTAHEAQGFIRQVIDFELVKADADYRRAAELAPQDAGAWLNLTVVNASLGRLEEAAEYGRRSITLDPLNSGYYVYVARTLMALGRYDETVDLLHKAIEFQPQAAQTHTELATVEILRGNYAVAAAEAKQETDPFWREYALALAEFANGDRAAADNALAALRAGYADSGAFQIALVYALRKEPDDVFVWLEHGLATRDPGVPTLLYAPFLGPYRSDPRFAALCAKLKLPAPTVADAKR
ncbi:MAG TPA: hypothetical protein VKB52_12270 [Rhodanobacteraceae bacterium]|nr:hypothetical protein [Rhodanobacteraceae bacterium]